MMNLAFAGFRHGHILALYDTAKDSPLVNLCGAFEEDSETREAMACEKGISFRYETYEELLADPAVDAVAIGDYYSARGARVIAALHHTNIVEVFGAGQEGDYRYYVMSLVDGQGISAPWASTTESNAAFTCTVSVTGKLWGLNTTSGCPKVRSWVSIFQEMVCSALFS